MPLKIKINSDNRPRRNYGNIARGHSEKTNRTAIIVLALNSSESELGIHDVAVITGAPLSCPEQNRHTVIEINSPIETDNLDQFVVCMDSIPSGRIGRVIVNGLAWAKTNAGLGAYGTLEAGHDYLTIGASGPAQILATSDQSCGTYLDSEGQPHSAGLSLVRFPSGAGGTGESTYLLTFQGKLGFCSDAG